jgi:serine/threonine protein kinase
VVKVLRNRTDGLKEARTLIKVNNLEGRRLVQRKTPVKLAPRLRSVCQSGPYVALVMERAATSLDKRKYLTKRDVAKLVAKLELLHANGITHLDIKSDNFLVLRNGDVIFGDFGLGGKATATNRAKDWQYFAEMLLVNDIPLPPYVFAKIRTPSQRRAILRTIREFSAAIPISTTQLRRKLLSGDGRGLLETSRGQTWSSFGPNHRFPLKLF